MKTTLLCISFVTLLIGCLDPNFPIYLEDVQNEYIMLEYIHETETEHIEGVESFVNIHPAGNYWFDENTKVLRILPEPDFHLSKDEPFNLILGVKRGITGDLAASERGQIFPVEEFPYEFPGYSDDTFGSSKSLTVINFDGSGTVFLRYNDRTIDIKPNSEMNIQEEPRIEEALGAKIRFTDSYIFKNHGYCSKADILLQGAVGD
ncbi:TPA: hypothetical protein EYP66_25425 [Candidatus Poribacteria bacterium]|nr:hypothetical protein [Candidatus Poribacteria bacterium]